MTSRTKEEIARALAERHPDPASLDRFFGFLEGKGATGAPHLTDLYVAFGAGEGDEAFVSELAARVLSLTLSTRRARVSEDTLDEARQVLLERLLVGAAGGERKILAYDGRGPLDAWLRVSLAREAVHLHKRERRSDGDDLLRLEDDSDDQEVRYLKAFYRDRFRAAFEKACSELDRKERALLRQHLVLGIGIDRLAAIYSVHRATAARWVDGAREVLMNKTRRELEVSLVLPRGEVERIAALIQSRLDFSLHRVLDTRGRTMETVRSA